MSEEQNAIIDEFKEASINRTMQIMEEINYSMNLISKSGYDFKNISISAGIPPSLSSSSIIKKI